MVVFSQTTSTERLRQNRLDAGTIDWLWFSFNTILILTGFFLLPSLWVSSGRSKNLTFGPGNFLGCGAIITSASFCLSAIFRWVSLRFWDKTTVTVIACTQYAFLFICCPLILYGVFANLTKVARLENPTSADTFHYLSLTGYLSPIITITPWAWTPLQNDLHLLRIEGTFICCLAHLLVGLFFFNCYRLRRRKLPIRILS
ncbi:MAG: hypothetical protein AAF514_14680 [Verrucomicrobiota bacterium]